MFYLTYDSDRTIGMLREDIQSGELSGEELAEFCREALKDQTTDVQNLEEFPLQSILLQGGTASISSAVDQYGDYWDQIEFAVTSRFEKNGKIYVSDGTFAVSIVEAYEEAHKDLQEFLATLD